MVLAEQGSHVLSICVQMDVLSHTLKRCLGKSFDVLCDLCLCRSSIVHR